LQEFEDLHLDDAQLAEYLQHREMERVQRHHYRE
jgi:hypothetical protein